MSANNVIYIRKVGDLFHVWEQFMEEYPIDWEPETQTFDSYDDAISAAYSLADDLMVVEYGVQILPPAPDIADQMQR